MKSLVTREISTDAEINCKIFKYIRSINKQNNKPSLKTNVHCLFASYMEQHKIFCSALFNNHLARDKWEKSMFAIENIEKIMSKSGTETKKRKFH